MFDYAPLAATAARLVAQFGNTATINRPSGMWQDPRSGTVTAGVPLSISMSAIVGDITDNYAQNFTVQQGDRLLTSTEETKIGDRITIDGEGYQVIDVVTTKPGPVALVYRAQVRK